MEAKLYEAQENFEFRGVKRKKGDTFRITDEKAEGLGGKVVLASNQSIAPSSSEPSPEQSESKPESSLPENMNEEETKTPEGEETPAEETPAEETPATPAE